MFGVFNLAAEGNFFSQYWLIFVLLALIIVMYVFSFSRRKKYNNQVQEMVNSLKPGEKVKTYSGFYGTIVSIKETTDGKVVLLEMGQGSKVSYIEVDINAIYGVDRKEDVIYDKDGNIIDNTPTASIEDKKEEPKVVETQATVLTEDDASNEKEVKELEKLAEGKSSKSKKTKK